MYSAKIFRDNIQGTVDYFANYIYPYPALQPSYEWLAANTISSPIPPPKIDTSSGQKVHINLNKAEESSLVNQIAIYKLKGNCWVLVKVLPTKGDATDLDVGLELQKGYYAATLVDRFGREGMKSHFEI